MSKVQKMSRSFDILCLSRWATVKRTRRSQVAVQIFWHQNWIMTFKKDHKRYFSLLFYSFLIWHKYGFGFLGWFNLQVLQCDVTVVSFQVFYKQVARLKLIFGRTGQRKGCHGFLGGDLKILHLSIYCTSNVICVYYTQASDRIPRKAPQMMAIAAIATALRRLYRWASRVRQISSSMVHGPAVPLQFHPIGATI